MIQDSTIDFKGNFKDITSFSIANDGKNIDYG